SLIASILFGLIPALVATNRAPWEALKKSPSGWSWSRLKPTGRQILLTAQVTVGVVLSVSGLLFARSLYKMASQDPGFSYHNILLARIDLPRMSKQEAGTYYRSLLSSLRETSGIHSASLSNAAPLSGGFSQLNLSIPERIENYGLIAAQRISHGY